MVDDPSNGHRDEFGISERRSFLPGLQILAVGLSMYQSQIAGTWRGLRDRKIAALARTTESIKGQ